MYVTPNTALEIFDNAEELELIVANEEHTCDVPGHFDYGLRLLIGQPLPCNELHCVSRKHV